MYCIGCQSATPQCCRLQLCVIIDTEQLFTQQLCLPGSHTAAGPATQYTALPV